MNVGYVKLHRKLIKWEWYNRSEMVHLFLHFLLLANHEDGKWQGQLIKKGQFVTGLDKLHIETGISRQTIRTCINRLKLTGEITSKSTNKYRIITIVNWEQYQLDEKKLTSKLTSKLTNNQHSTNKQLTANKNDKNDKNIRRKIIPKGITEKSVAVAETKTFGNNLINSLIEILKKFNRGLGLDGTIKNNRYGAKRVSEKIKKSFKEKLKREPTEEEIGLVLKTILNKADNFHKKNLTNFNYLDRNFYKIIKSSQAGRKVIDLDNKKIYGK